MKEKQIHLGEILSIITGRLVALDGIGGVYNILNFMTGDNLFTHQLPRASKECEPVLLEQFPQFDTGDFQLEFGELITGLESEVVQNEKEAFCKGWLSKMMVKYGEFFPVKPLKDFVHISPIIEAESMFGKEKVIVLETK